MVPADQSEPRIRPATRADDDAVFAIIAPVIAAGETYTVPREWDRAHCLAYWFAPGHEVFVCEVGGAVLGSYFLQAN